MFTHKKTNLIGGTILALSVFLLWGCNQDSSKSEEKTPVVSEEPTIMETPVMITVAGVAADGLAQANSEVFLIDVNEEETSVAQTNTEGKFSFELSETQVFPLIIAVSRTNQTPMCTILTEKPANSTTLTAHINPVTTLVCHTLLENNLPSSLSRVHRFGISVTDQGRMGSTHRKHLSTSLYENQRQNRSLIELLNADLETTGQQITEKIFGTGLSFSTFSSDPTFQARSDNSTALPSVADTFLDTLQSLAVDNTQTLDQLLQSELNSTQTIPFLEQDEFQVELSSVLIEVGYDTVTSVENLSQVVNRTDVVDTVGVIAGKLETVKDEAIAQGISDQTELAILLTGVTTGIKEVIKQEKANRNVQQLSSIDANALDNLTTNVIGSVKDSIIELVKTRPTALADNASLSSVVKNAAKQVAQLTEKVSITGVLDAQTLVNLQQASQDTIQSTATVLTEAVANSNGDWQSAINASQDQIVAIAQEKAQNFGNPSSSGTNTNPTSEGTGTSGTTTAGTEDVVAQNNDTTSTTQNSIPTSSSGNSSSNNTGPTSPSPNNPGPTNPGSTTTIITSTTTPPITSPPVATSTAPPTTVPPIGVQILQPSTLITVGSSPIQISGTVDEDDVALTVNGSPIALNGKTFSAAVSLEEGGNTIVARVSNANTETTASILVYLDMTPPYITIDSLKEGQLVNTPTVMLSGLVNDIVRGTVNDDQANVVITSELLNPGTARVLSSSANNVIAPVSNRSYLAPVVPLEIGENRITVTASDQVGNVNSKSIKVRYELPLDNHLELISGQNQKGTISNELPEALQVKLVDKNKQPLAGKNVVFRVVQGDGVVGAETANPAQAVIVQTDDGGVASTRFKIGSRSGNGNQHVKATAVGVKGGVLFFASAVPRLPDKITVNSGNNQRGGAKQQLGEPFVINITDSGANVLKDVPVEFKVTKGNGKLQNGQIVYQTKTDSDGRASAHLTLGEKIGMDQHWVTTTIVGTNLTAVFTASALRTGQPGNTRISGIVLDTEDHPLPNVAVRVEGTTRQAFTDSEGQFVIPEVPVGPIHLIADGSTTTVSGDWPTLSYNMITVVGADNPLPSPIYMLRLNTENAKLVGDKDVKFTLPEVPGFKLKILKDSVTFPDGKKTGYLSVTVVNSSKVPMAPPNGMQPQFIITIQPTGTMFDPPAPITLPNFDGHPPGAQPELYSYDHDLEEFVIIGIGKVSEDGQVIESLPGVGVIKAGWHCGSQPTVSGCVYECNQCQSCGDNCSCEADLSKNGLEIGNFFVCSNGNLVRLTEAQPNGLLHLGIEGATHSLSAGKSILRAHWSQRDNPELTNLNQSFRTLRSSLQLFKKELTRMNSFKKREQNARYAQARQSTRSLIEQTTQDYNAVKAQVFQELEKLRKSTMPSLHRSQENSAVTNLRRLKSHLKKGRRTPTKNSDIITEQLRSYARTVAVDAQNILTDAPDIEPQKVQQLIDRLTPKTFMDDYSIIVKPKVMQTQELTIPDPPNPLPGPSGE